MMENRHNGLEDLVANDFDLRGLGAHGVHADGIYEQKESGEELDCYDGASEDERKNKHEDPLHKVGKGRDIQGIQWECTKFTRLQYRETRLKQYKNYGNISNSNDELKECKPIEKGSRFYDFQYNTRLVKPTVTHFQLRNLIWAKSKHDVYLLNFYSIMHWSSLRVKGREILNVSGQISPHIKTSETPARPVSRVQVSTLCVKENLMAAGGFQGELICKHLNHGGVTFCSKVTSDENPITNGVDIFRSTSGSVRLLTANNDRCVRIFDTESFTLLNQFLFSWSVNNTSSSPDGKLLTILGDSNDCLLADAQSGKAVGHLKGHLDYSFTSAWHPEGRVFATGSQDRTCRIWDLRNMSASLAVLRGRMAAIRGVKFTEDGKFMAVAEAADFVHIVDAKESYRKVQELDLFGEIAGISFSPDTEALFIGVADRTLGSLMELRRRHQLHYLDPYF